MNAVFDCSIFGRQSESVKAYRMQYIETVHALVSCIDIGRSHGEPVPDMKIARGIREHRQCVEFRAGIIVFNVVELVIRPLLPPLFFYVDRVVLFRYFHG